MIPTLENAIEIVKALPPPEREKFFDWVEEEKQNEQSEKETKGLELAQKNEKFQQALQWIEEHKEEYDGQFVLLEGGQLIAHGNNPKELYAAARAKGISVPFVKRVKAKDLPFGGW